MASAVYDTDLSLGGFEYGDSFYFVKDGMSIGQKHTNDSVNNFAILVPFCGRTGRGSDRGRGTNRAEWLITCTDPIATAPGSDL